MNSHDSEHEEKLQAAAEQAERRNAPAGDAAVDAYRFVQRAVRRAAMPGLPADFARNMAARIRALEESAGLERGLMFFLMGSFAVGAAIYLLPTLVATLSSLNFRLPAIPLQPTLWLGAALALAWVVDRGWMAAHSRGQAI
jgi:hypothetical protein